MRHLWTSRLALLTAALVLAACLAFALAQN